MYNHLAAATHFIAALPDRLENGAVTWVARLAPWAAPLPTAYLVYARTVEHLRWPDWVGFAAAVVIECLGLATVATSLMLREYNASKRKSDPRAPTWLAYILIVVYLFCAELLTVVLDIAVKWPNIGVVDLAPAVFPFLSLAGMAVLAVRADHARRLAAIAAGKAERKAERAAKSSGKVAPAAASPIVAVEMPVDPDGNGHQPWSYAAFVRQYPDLADMTGREVGKLAGVHERTGRNWLARWRKEHANA